MPTAADVTGLILAGGAGRRTGGRDKGLLPWRGEPLVNHVAARLRPEVRRLLVSCNRNQARYAEIADAVVTDSRGNFQGPLAGIEAAAAAVDTALLVVAACDTPLLPGDLVPRLLRRLLDGNRRVDIVYAHDGERDHYLCAALDRRCLATLTAYLDEGGRAVRHWIRLHPHASVDFSDCPEAFRNVNRPE